jgi:hypothetical protein
MRVALACCFGAWALAALLLGSNVGLSIPALLVTVHGGGAILLFSLVAIVIGVVRKQRLRRPWLEPAGVLAVLALISLDLPFHARFFASLPFLHRDVQRVAASGRPGPLPRLVGLFRVREVELLPNGVVRMITASCMFDDCGLAFSRGGPPPVVGEDSYDRITPAWWQWERSW